MYTCDGSPLDYKVDIDSDIELDNAHVTIWLTQEDLENMLQEIKEAKEDV